MVDSSDLHASHRLPVVEGGVDVTAEVESRVKALHDVATPHSSSQ